MQKDEAIIRILGKTTLEFPEFDQLKLRGILEEVLYDYNVETQETAIAIADNVQDRIIMYLAAKKIDGLSKKTLYNYKLHLVRFSNFIRKNVEDITTMDIRMYLATVGKNLKNTSLATEINILKSFFNWLEIEDYINKSPAKKLNKPKTEKRLRKSLNIEELEILKESCETLRERALIEMIYCTGCRLDEVVKLNKDDIDWQNMSIKVIGKGDKQREVYVSPKAKIHIQKYLSSRQDDCDALFVTQRLPIRRLGGRAIQKEVKKVAERTGFNKSIYPHLLRHTTATLMLNNGADIVTVQQILGHEDVATTQVYAAVSKERVIDQYKKCLVQQEGTE